ncbi:DUF6074 family protein [Methylobacterium ajmalii]|jgi:hypothetical protein|uniref:DUF6074 family protein n=1 Tax=Methylobacterium ajmalii TaxID=2738439 RepID=UPI00190CD145|nr:DUF6074 family protein [Methylobacterium ajmalii]MBK3398912.1 hypothetical protein [Methylobacterium ajmalii]MBK3409569.1 hypothetical protein [Methylobacterium ajmalii]MBK3425676.1 hypothetical protein [Methylobacterium ajmalii]
MREIHLFPGAARRGAVRTVADAAFPLEPVESDRIVREAADRHAAEVRTFGDDEAVIAADATGFRRAVEDELQYRRVQAIIEDPEELQAAREIVGALFGRGRA